MKCRKLHDGRLVHVVAPTIDFCQLPGVTHKTISNVEREYWLYHGATVDNTGQPAEEPGDVEDELDDSLTQEAI